MPPKSFKAHPFHEGAGDAEVFHEAGVARQVNATWFRGETVNYLPSKAKLLADAGEYLLHGLTPKSPVITPETGVLTFGSCFAANVARRLAAAGYSISADKETASEEELGTMVVGLNEGIVNTFTSRQMMEWVFDGKTPNLDVWHDKSANAFGVDASARQATRAVFERAGAYIITLGLAEVWYDKSNGEVYSRAIPKADYDPARHGFRVSTVAENLENLKVVLGYLRKLKPEAPVIFTLSPVPLLATFRPISCVVANSVSKAVLRVAVDELLRGADDPNLYYWPSYELVKDVFPDAFEADNRHPRQEVIDYAMGLFARHFCTGGEPIDVEEARFRLLTATGLVPKPAAMAMEAAEPAAMLELVGRALSQKRLAPAQEMAAQAARSWPGHPEVVAACAEVAAFGAMVGERKKTRVEERNEKRLARRAVNREKRSQKA